MKKLHIRLFGKLSVKYESKPLSGLESTKVQELFCYLLLHRDRPHPRTTLASILWGDVCTTANSRKYLRTALWRLRSAMSQVQGLSNLLRTDAEWVELRTGASYWLDAAEFANAHNVSQKLGAFDLQSHVVDMEKASRLYTGYLLANWNQDWCVLTRDRYHQHYLALLDRLAEHHEINGSYDSVFTLTERLLESDPAHERSHRRLMRVYVKTGDRTNALRQYARCVDALKNELGVEPGPKTRAVLERICDGKPPHAHLATRRSRSVDLVAGATGAAT